MTERKKPLIKIDKSRIKEELVRSSLEVGKWHSIDYRQKQLTLRDQFAMAALTGLLASDAEDTMTFKQTAEFAYEAADAMLIQKSLENKNAIKKT